MNDIENTKEWFRHSENNLISAKHLFNDLCPKQTEIAAYFSQQAAETALKGFLYYSGINDPEHTHNKVYDFCVSKIPELNNTSSSDLVGAASCGYASNLV
jgi:hypothetical protein